MVVVVVAVVVVVVVAGVVVVVVAGVVVVPHDGFAASLPFTHIVPCVGAL